ncbi:MAG: NADH-quinone oxidoreductase subunit C [Chloroflexi bacterium]|nr:NADH-quinone oxidoreductase subunit C [Chloroflexota bacterium]
MSQSPPPGAAISLRQTLPNSKWLGVVCPKCGNTIAEGNEAVLCPKCYTPHHAQCWRDNGNQCANDGTPARIIERPGRAAGPAATAAPVTAPTAPAARAPAAAPAPAAPARPAAAAPPVAAGARPAPPRPVPGAAATAGGAARPAGRAPAGPVVREAPGLRPMAEVRRRLEQVLGDLNPQFGTAVDEVTCTVPPERIQEVARRAKEHELLRFDYLRCLSGVDYQAEGIEVVYHLFSTRLQQKCVLKARLPGEGQSLPTVTAVWAGANWHERETAEMFNIGFDGHPHLEPLLLEKDDEGRIVPGPILLKRFPLRPKEPPGIFGFPEEE